MESNATHDIGGRLRTAREKQGLTLRDLSQRTKLQVHVLQAIERNDFCNLPEGLFRRAYVRMVAAEVGLDPAHVAAEYCAHYETPAPAPAAARVDRVEDKWIEQLSPSPRRSIMSLAAFVALAAAWFMWQPGVAEAPREVAVSRAFVDVPAGDVVDAVREHPIDVIAPAVAADNRAVPLSIEIVAASWCWIAAETDGQRALYRLVEPGERVMLEGQELIRLRIGDAGAVTLSINDGPRRSLGENGEVVELEVTADTLDRWRDSAMKTASET